MFFAFARLGRKEKNTATKLFLVAKGYFINKFINVILCQNIVMLDLQKY